MTVTRRKVLTTTAAAVPGTPRIARAQSARTLRFVPSADLATIDPYSGGGATARQHGNAVYDWLFAYDAAYEPQPQMVAGAATEDDGRIWDLTLREGLMFHDNTHVLARDCVASIRRWAARDSFGQALMARTDEIAAMSDKTIRFRLKKPFSLLPEALAQPACAMMPERIAAADPFKDITDATGSGPFRFLPDERVRGASWAYARFDKYVPRPEGMPSFLAGPRVTHFDRLVWTWVPDSATTAAAMAKGEFDWWENPSFDLLDLLKSNRDLRVEATDRASWNATLRFNHLHKPFNNPAIRRLVLSCVNEQTFMEAAAGGAPEYYRTKAGLFAPDTPMASQAGTAAMAARTDFDTVKKELAAAGYNGEKVVLIAAATVPAMFAEAQVADDLLRRMGFTVDLQTQDVARITQRRASKEPPEKGGWNAVIINYGGIINVTLPGNFMIRGGATAGPGWPDLPRIEALREDWLNAPTRADRKRIAADIQVQFFNDVPHVPLGQYFQPTCYRKDLADIPRGSPVMHNVRRL